MQLFAHPLAEKCATGNKGGGTAKGLPRDGEGQGKAAAATFPCPSPFLGSLSKAATGTAGVLGAGTGYQMWEN